MMPRTDNYRMAVAFGVYDRQGRYHLLEEGSYVRPLSLRYVPDHVLESPQNMHFRRDLHEFCFTKVGVVMIPKNRIREE